MLHVFTPHKLLFFSLPSKTCLELFVLQKPEGLETFAGTILLNPASGLRRASAMRALPTPAPLPPPDRDGWKAAGTQLPALSVFFLQRWASRARMAQQGHHAGIIFIIQVGRRKQESSGPNSVSC